MNIKLIILLAISLVTVSSCNDDYEQIDSMNPNVMTRAMNGNSNVATLNPDLLDNWEHVDKIYLNTLGTDNNKKSTSTPWSTTTMISTSLSDTFRKDIKKEDGWKILFHTFNEVGNNERQNYICFYNIFTGFIKVFYFYEGENQSQNTHWYIKTSGKQNVKLLDTPTYFTEAESATADNCELIVSNMSQNSSGGIEPGWNGFEFQVPRFCDDLEGVDFAIGAYDKGITTYSF